MLTAECWPLFSQRRLGLFLAERPGNPLLVRVQDIRLAVAGMSEPHEKPARPVLRSSVATEGGRRPQVRLGFVLQGRQLGNSGLPAQFWALRIVSANF